MRGLTRFGWWLGGLTILAMTLRLGFAFGLAKPITAGDAAEFREVAKNFAEGRGYSLKFFDQGLQPTAQHPPLFPLLLAGLDVIGLGSLGAQRLFLGVLSSMSVPVMGVLGRRLKNPAIGLGAAAIAAVHPLWVQPSGVVMSESTYLVLIPLILYVAVRCLDEPRRLRWFALLGFAMGASILNRSEAVGLIALLGVPTVWLAAPALRSRVKAGAIVIVASLVIVGPWLVRNYYEMGAAKLSTNTGNMIGAYCAETFTPGPRFGTYFVGCPFTETPKLIYGPPPHGAKAWTFNALDDELGSKTLDFVKAHVPQLPAIGAVHVLRVWGFWDPPFEVKYDVDEGRDAVVQRVGWGVHYLLLLFALVWVVEVPVRERRRWMCVLAPALLVTLSAMVFYGSTRLRVAAEPSIALAAAAGVGVVADRWRRHRASSDHGATPAHVPCWPLQLGPDVQALCAHGARGDGRLPRGTGGRSWRANSPPAVARRSYRPTDPGPSAPPGGLTHSDRRRRGREPPLATIETSPGSSRMPPPPERYWI